MKTLFLHIGTSKTGTSSIQAFCGKNRQVFESKGYCYPYTVHYQDVSDNRNAHFMVGFLKDKDGKRDYKEEERLFSLGMEKLHECFREYDNVVMSEENIWGMSNTSFKNLWSLLKEDSAANNYTIKMIVYLRRQDTFLTSRWNQLVKGGKASSETWSEHLLQAPSKSKMMLDYAASLNRIADFFGKENIIVRRFSRDSFYGGTIYADFIRCLGLEMSDGFEELQESENLSLKGNIVEIMRVMNTTPVINKANHVYWKKMLAMCSKESDKYYKYNMFSKEEAEAFLERYREDNEKIVADFIGDGKPLFDYDVDDLPKWEKQNEYMLDDVIRVFTVLAYDAHQEIENLKKQVNALEKQAVENRLSVGNISRKGKNYIRRKLGLKSQ